ncbi:hypothetical protein PsorP6_018616 [Peronosclerospora sorghi]|nr:hypothetical protein PsorP6_018616 [Peronosclerospora sorghi]
MMPTVSQEKSNTNVRGTRKWDSKFPRCQLPPVPRQTKTFAPVYPIPKRAAKETPTYKVADATQVTDPRVAARTDSPRVHQGSVESPSAATVMNCTESEKSLVQLLSSLNQSGTPITLPADTRSQSGNDSSQNTLRYGSKELLPRTDLKESRKNLVMRRSSHLPNREMTDSFCQAKSSNPKQSLTISMDSGASPSRDRVDVDTRSVEGYLTLNRKASASEGEYSRKSSASEDVAFRSDSQSRHIHELQINSAMEVNVRIILRRSIMSSPVAILMELIQPRTSPYNHHHHHCIVDQDVHAKYLLTLLHLLHLLKPRKEVHTNVKSPLRPKKRGKGEDKVKADSERDLDTNLDYCEVCQGAGDLVCCDKCPRSFHLKCLRMTENDLPEGYWQCDECKKPSRFDAFSVAVAGEKTVLNKCLKIVQCLNSHPSSKPFLSPVENVPMYTKVQHGGEGGKELDTTHFSNDVRLMWSNCKLFNDDGSGITRDADILSAGFERLYKESIAPPLRELDEIKSVRGVSIDEALKKYLCDIQVEVTLPCGHNEKMK